MEKFIKDLKKGEAGEGVVANFLQTKGFKIISFNKDINYDIVVEKNNKLYRVEVKTDEWEFYNKKITNNMFIEVSCSNKPSGIVASKCDIFVYYFPHYNLVYMIKKKKLLEILLICGERKAFSGDGGRVVGYTINRLEYGHYFNIYDISLRSVNLKKLGIK